MITNILFKDRKRKVFVILEHLPYHAKNIWAGSYTLYSLSFLYNDTYPELFHNQFTSIKPPVKRSLGSVKSPFSA